MRYSGIAGPATSSIFPRGVPKLQEQEVRDIRGSVGVPEGRYCASNGWHARNEIRTQWVLEWLLDRNAAIS